MLIAWRPAQALEKIEVVCRSIACQSLVDPQRGYVYHLM
jgi:hypothetical protein